MDRLRARRERARAVADSQAAQELAEAGVHFDTPPARAPEPAPELPREPRHVRAVPTNADLKMERALDVFNASDHVRTVGGVARSLGPPAVSVRPLADRPSVVAITVMWELSWYRFEVDLSDEGSGVRREGQGAELSDSRRRSSGSTPPPTSAAACTCAGGDRRAKRMIESRRADLG